MILCFCLTSPWHGAVEESRCLYPSCPRSLGIGELCGASLCLVLIENHTLPDDRPCFFPVIVKNSYDHISALKYELKMYERQHRDPMSYSFLYSP